MSEYLEQANLKKMEIGKVRTLIRIRCGNVEKDNKYWLEEDSRKCMRERERYFKTLHRGLQCDKRLVCRVRRQRRGKI